MTVQLRAGGFFTGSGEIDAQALTDRLNSLGEEGWELVSVFDTNRNTGETRNVVAILKRSL